MRIYHYDENGLQVGESDATESPMEPGVFLVPAFATDIPPGNAPTGKRRKFNGAAWVNEAIPAPDTGPVKTLAELKAEKQFEITAARNGAEMAGFQYLGETFDSDMLSVQRIGIAAQAANAAIAAGQPFALGWGAKNNVIVNMTAAQVAGMPVALATAAVALHEKSRLLKAQIEAATTAAEVEAVVWV